MTSRRAMPGSISGDRTACNPGALFGRLCVAPQRRVRLSSIWGSRPHPGCGFRPSGEIGFGPSPSGRRKRPQTARTRTRDRSTAKSRTLDPSTDAGRTRDPRTASARGSPRVPQPFPTATRVRFSSMWGCPSHPGFGFRPFAVLDRMPGSAIVHVDATKVTRVRISSIWGSRAHPGCGFRPSGEVGCGFRPSGEIGFGPSPSGRRKRPQTARTRTRDRLTAKRRTRDRSMGAGRIRGPRTASARVRIGPRASAPRARPVCWQACRPQPGPHACRAPVLPRARPRASQPRPSQPGGSRLSLGAGQAHRLGQVAVTALEVLAEHGRQGVGGLVVQRAARP